MFVSDRQRKAVMAIINRADDDCNRMIQKSSVPIVIRSEHVDEKKLENDFNDMIRKLKDEEERIMMDANDSKIVFSDKRGSVPLLDTTFVIRGGTPKERQVVKKLLDAIGSEAALMDINTIRIEPDMTEPFALNRESRTISLRSGDLHVKSGDFPIDLAMMVYARALVERNPAISDEDALGRAKDAVALYMADLQHKERLKKEKEAVDVYQVGVDRQPEFESSVVEGPVTSPAEVRIRYEEPKADVSDMSTEKPIFAEPDSVDFGGGEMR